MDCKKGDYDLKLFEASFLGQLSNVVDSEMVNNQYSLLVDGSFAEESGEMIIAG